MEEYRARRISQRSGFRSRGLFGDQNIKYCAWRRGQDRGKRRLTHGIYGTKTQLSNALATTSKFTIDLRWNEFRNGKFMVW